ncbi:sensor histidine kinase RegB [Roseovarius rhodophyticola]|uniref:histidine kinase n=1 Tax=Roseovarius rhodophyticola TaxID=3080827 RepID=A0ABZ2TK76_9RHOB|nr:ActS/PrrB/RegB family redox-sensitive histidine kinase [Roseovarius sp. W115]MDV2930031.1 ActS/PrrB/RegB family redox-sensitive histidine kinase [Roseovarius sp. W115]
MSDAPINPTARRADRNWIRLRTLILLRWWAVAGQFGALLVAQHILNLSLEYGLCYFVVGVSVITNVVAGFIFPENKRLSEGETLLFVLFDMLQLGLLLYLTGGLHNPFSILIVGPVIVSASALSTRSTIFLGFCAVVITSVLSWFYISLTDQNGVTLSMPDIFLFGNWIAIVIAVAFLGVYARRLVSEMHAMSEALQATQMALAREQKLTDLGGVVAAAAHELGTPLATIKLTSSELAEELTEDEDLRDDALLIKEQADRCRDILRSMGRAGKDDLHLRRAPLTAVIEEAAEPHLDRGKELLFDAVSKDVDPSTQPTILRRPEVIHGVRNLIQNAVDFSERRVWVDSDWTDQSITVRIMDDGKGYPVQYLGRIGEPFMRKRTPQTDPQRPEYEGMGLGLFIAKTLLERSGAELSFANGSDTFTNRADFAERKGAFVEVTWPRERLEEAAWADRRSLGSNVPIEI